MFNNYNLSYVQDYLFSNFDNYSININKYDAIILGIHAVKFSFAVSNIFHLVRGGHFMNAPYQYTIFTGISISDDIFAIYRQLSKISFGIYDGIVTTASVSVTTATSIALAHNAKDQIDEALVKVRSDLETAKVKLNFIDKLESNPNQMLLMGIGVTEPTDEMREAKRKYIEKEKPIVTDNFDKHTKSENRLVKDQQKIGSQDYVTFLLTNGATIAQMNEIIEKEGFNFELLKPKAITVSVNAFMCFGYGIYIHPKLPASMIGNEKTAASIKVGIQTVASIVITSTFTFGGKLYDLAYDTLFNKNEDADKDTSTTKEHSTEKIAEEIKHEDQHDHGEL